MPSSWKTGCYLVLTLSLFRSLSANKPAYKINGTHTRAPVFACLCVCQTVTRSDISWWWCPKSERLPGMFSPQLANHSWNPQERVTMGGGGTIFVRLLVDVHAEIWYFLHSKHRLTSSWKESGWAVRQRHRDMREAEGDSSPVPAMWVQTAGSSDRLSAENQWSLTSCSWEFRPMAAGPLGRTDVSSLTEMVSMATGDSGSGVGEVAAGKEKMMSLPRWHHRWLCWTDSREHVLACLALLLQKLSRMKHPGKYSYIL